MSDQQENKDSKPLNKLMLVALFIFGAAAIAAPMLFATYLMFPYPIYERDESGTLDCNQLKEVVSNGHYDYLSYNYPKFFNLGSPHKTVAHFESAKSHKFSMCRHDIEEQRSSWCDDYVQRKLEGLSLNTKIPKEIYHLCMEELNATKSDINQSFEVRRGNNGSAIKLKSGWVSLQSVEIRDPIEFSPWPGAGMSMQCVVDGQWLSCKPFSNEQQALREQERLLNIGYELGLEQSYQL
ncbi:hypothetical protein [Vibrio parahaemolyticus]|uniref:hypothetical protein n=1 Tax=Vibrio parahaemolyticus TaxID=670 RepID=UPI003D81391E